VSRARGFTLIEVLVALAVAALGLAAALSVVTHSARNVNYLRDKTLASWIALNQITTVHLSLQLPSVDKTDGDLDYANDKWKWVQTVTQTDVPGIRRLDIAVRRAGDPEDAPIASMTAFVGRTQVTTNPSGATWDLQGQPAPGGTQGTQQTTTTTTTASQATTTQPATPGHPP